GGTTGGGMGTGGTTGGGAGTGGTTRGESIVRNRLFFD
ncbi:cytochrome b5, partial [Clostridium sp. 2-1]